MADNVNLTAGDGTIVAATDKIGGVDYQRVKVNWGPDGTSQDADAASGKALPVQGEAAENAAATGNPVAVGGRYDSSARTLGNGDRGEIAINASGQVQVDLAAGTLPDTSGGALAALLGAISGTEMQIDIVGGTLPDTSAGDLAAINAALAGTLSTGISGSLPDTASGDLATIATATGAAATLLAGTLDTTIAGNLPDTAGGALASIASDATGILADTASMDNNLGTVAGAVSGTEMQVDVVGALPAGTNAIGKLAANSGVDIGDVDVLSLPDVTVTPASTTKAVISAASSGDNTVVAAAGSGNIITVTSLFLIATSAVTVRFESGASGTALTGVMSLAANSGFVLPHNPDGWFETGANALLNLELGGAVQVSGALSYIVTT